MRILFVDDLKDARDLFRIAFAMQGHSIQLAANGLEAIATVQNSDPFDVIVMDVEMPEMNGWDAVRTIRSLPQGEEVPIVMFTAYGNGVTLKMAQDVGANGVLHKPLSPKELLTRVAQMAA